VLEPDEGKLSRPVLRGLEASNRLRLLGNEWAKIKDAAALYWPDAALDTQMSRQEASRRLLLSGMDQLRATAQAERRAAVNGYAQSLQPPADKMLSALPVGPE
jgi:hypothetical protein